MCFITLSDVSKEVYNYVNITLFVIFFVKLKMDLYEWQQDEGRLFLESIPEGYLGSYLGDNINIVLYNTFILCE